MVKGISRQVILVHSPDPELFDQAIFILKDSAVKEGVTDAQLLRQARAAIGREPTKGKKALRNLLWAGIGAAFTGLLWAAVWLF